LITATRKDERWSMDFMYDQLQDGRRLRVLTVVDQYAREMLAPRHVDCSRRTT